MSSEWPAIDDVTEPVSFIALAWSMGLIQGMMGNAHWLHVIFCLMIQSLMPSDESLKMVLWGIASLETSCSQHDCCWQPEQQPVTEWSKKIGFFSVAPATFNVTSVQLLKQEGHEFGEEPILRPNAEVLAFKCCNLALKQCTARKWPKSNHPVVNMSFEEVFGKCLRWTLRRSSFLRVPGNQQRGTITFMALFWQN